MGIWCRQTKQITICMLHTISRPCNLSFPEPTCKSCQQRIDSIKLIKLGKGTNVCFEWPINKSCTCGILWMHRKRPDTAMDTSFWFHKVYRPIEISVVSIDVFLTFLSWRAHSTRHQRQGGLSLDVWHGPKGGAAIYNDPSRGHPKWWFSRGAVPKRHRLPERH